MAAQRGNGNKQRISAGSGIGGEMAAAPKGGITWREIRQEAAAITSPSRRACVRLLSKPFWSHPMGSASAGNNGKGDRT